MNSCTRHHKFIIQPRVYKYIIYIILFISYRIYSCNIYIYIYILIPNNVILQFASFCEKDTHSGDMYCLCRVYLLESCSQKEEETIYNRLKKNRLIVYADITIYHWCNIKYVGTKRKGEKYSSVHSKTKRFFPVCFSFRFFFFIYHTGHLDSYAYGRIPWRVLAF